jgi:hypothetical protein
VAVWRWAVRQETMREGCLRHSITVDAPGVVAFSSCHNKIHDTDVVKYVEFGQSRGTVLLCERTF